MYFYIANDSAGRQGGPWLEWAGWSVLNCVCMLACNSISTVSSNIQNFWLYKTVRMLTLVLLNPDITCLYKQCRSRSVISWLLKKPTDVDLHCLSLSIWICINNMDQGVWMAENWKWAWHLNLFSKKRVKHWWALDVLFGTLLWTWTFLYRKSSIGTVSVHVHVVLQENSLWDFSFLIFFIKAYCILWVLIRITWQVPT